MIITKFLKRGKRIKPSDKSLVYNIALLVFLILFLLVLLPFYLKFIITGEWQAVTLRYILFSLGVSVIVSFFLWLIIVLLYYRYRIDFIKKLEHRQKLAQMILQNGWYESEQVRVDGFFKDLSSSKSKERITHFPKMYYYLREGLIHINVEITMGKYQDQLLKLENRLESGLYCELVDKELKESYIEYTLLYDTIGSRISIDEAIAEDGRLKLMDTVYWEYDKLPHMLIAGGTGGGKSYFILTLIESLLHTKANLYILDPKNSDLADLATVMDNVYYLKEDIMRCIEQFYNNMMIRSEEMKKHPNYKTGENYAYLGLPANFLIFDEYIAFIDMLGRESNEVMSSLKKVIMLGRQLGFFIILACQRPDAKYLGDGIRDQFNFRVALGRMSELGYSMMFGEVEKQFFLKPIKGRGYVDTGVNVISEFYTPLVPKGYDFLERIGKLANKLPTGQASDGVKDAGPVEQ